MVGKASSVVSFAEENKDNFSAEVNAILASECKLQSLNGLVNLITLNNSSVIDGTNEKALRLLPHLVEPTRLVSRGSTKRVSDIEFTRRAIEGFIADATVRI